MKGEREVSVKLMNAAARVAQLLFERPRTKPELVAELGMAPVTVKRAIEYLRDRGAWIDFSRKEGLNQWSLRQTGIDWRDLTLGEVHRAGLLPGREAWILAAAAQNMPEGFVVRRQAVANPATLRRRLIA